MKLSLPLAGLLGATLAVSTTVTLAQVATTGAVQSTPADTPFSSAVRAVRDQATGKLRRATPDEVAAMLAAEKAERAARGLPDTSVEKPVVVRQHANGMLSAELSAEHLVSVQAHRRADGKLVRSHVHPSMEHPTAPVNKQRPTE